MNQQELIRQGQIGIKKQARLQALADAKAALRALANDVTFSQDKKVPDVNSELLQAHLNRFKEKQQEIAAIDAELRDLE